MGGEAAKAAKAASALRAVTRPRHASGAVERRTWREWGQSNPMSLASLASVATIAAGGAGLAIVLAARAARAARARNARLALQSKITEDLVRMHINARKPALQEEIEEICVSRVHDLRDARSWGSQAHREGARAILSRILDKKEKKRSEQSTVSRALYAQIDFLKAAIAGLERALHVPDDSTDGERLTAQLRPARSVRIMAPQNPPELPAPAHITVTSGPSGPSGTGSIVPLYTSANPVSKTQLYSVTMNMEGNHNGVHEQYGHIATWDVRGVTDMGSAFYITEVDSDDLEDLSFWDTRKVRSMGGMFGSAVDFNGDISSWNTSNVTDMARMFYRASSFNQPLDKWNVSQVADMSNMFNGASAFNQDISGWKLQGDKFEKGMLGNMLRAERLAEGTRKKIASEWSLSDAQKNEAWILSSLVFGHSARRAGRVMI
jgi:surface protein